MTEKIYWNGWPNRETWVVQLHLCDEFDRLFVDYVKYCIEREEDLDEEGFQNILADHWERNYMVPLNVPQVIEDIMGDHRIDWYEIALHYVNSYKEDKNA